MRARHALRSVAVAIAVALATTVLVGPTAASAAPGPSDAPQWWFDDWDVPGLWADGARGQGITIAEIDTGVNADLPELAGKILPGKDFGDPAADGRVDHTIDEFGHGTAMASLMVAEPRYATYDVTGIAPDAKVLPIAVPLQETDVADQWSRSDYGDAVRWAVDNGAKIISMSLGSQRDPTYDAIPCLPSTQSAISYAISKGAIVVAASGNDGENGSPVAEPGVCIGVVAVGAVDRNDDVTSFSSRHPYVTMSAPGDRIPTLGRVPGQVYVGAGTSQATALTSAVFAIVWSKYPDLTNSQVIARVLATLDHKVAGDTPDEGYGFGIVDAGAAIRADVPLDAPNPLTTAMQPFVDAEQAVRPKITPPDPAATETAPPGEYAIGTRPGFISPELAGAAGLALTGLVAFLTLSVVGIIRRRRYKTAVAAAMPAAPWPYAGGPPYIAPYYQPPPPAVTAPGTPPAVPAPGGPAPGGPAPSTPPGAPPPTAGPTWPPEG